MPRLLSLCDVDVNGCAMGTSVQAGNGSARGTPRQRELAASRNRTGPPKRFGPDSGSRSGMEIVPSVP